ncbi:hypothetical protein N7510_010364 [Penicillium lagena]|uniref:uncharacterized protein n=1 Tax=Penicillium lagena TaxID=94218 RepID=UPI002540C10A|nr:uncharacterized protein N7510_010364 [Penicillium lagena]KAJ5605210.1 hypothetical protein N7510_010364 [Penicillium lagena]
MLACAGATPYIDMSIEDFSMWTEEGSAQWYYCESGYSSGFCLATGDDYTSYITALPLMAALSGYSAPTTVSDLAAVFGTAVLIPVPAIFTSIYSRCDAVYKLAGAKSFAASREGRLMLLGVGSCV